VKVQQRVGRTAACAQQPAKSSACRARFGVLAVHTGAITLLQFVDATRVMDHSVRCQLLPRMKGRKQPRTQSLSVPRADQGNESHDTRIAEHGLTRSLRMSRPS
jgi:hypothetical protein